VDIVGDIDGELARELVAKNGAIIAKMDVVGGIVGELAGELTEDLAGYPRSKHIMSL
jgi:uncharacterized membrane protein YeaQ/YmgE (transglycosylase-associated protein family)